MVKQDSAAGTFHFNDSFVNDVCAANANFQKMSARSI